ncbi:MAG: heavy metal translocating P-type ATPase [Planctomyces sp.]
MSSQSDHSDIHRKDPHRLEDHEGILDIRAIPGSESVEIAFDAGRLSEDDLRTLVNEHGDEVSALQRMTLRLNGSASEACATRLERRVENIPGVRRATATYLGRVLSLTFDSLVRPGTEMLREVRNVGARVEPLQKSIREEASASLSQRIVRGDLNEELSCGAGFLLLITAAVVESRGGMSTTAVVLYTLSYMACGWQGVTSAVASLRERVLDVDVLMVLAALGAAIVGAPFEGALLLFLFSFSNVLQHYAMERTQKAIQSLLTLRPETALVRRGSELVSVSLESLQIGDIVVVRPGEHIPVDGVVQEGRSSVDESSLTGESMPVTKEIGNPLFAGTLNQSGGIELRVTRLSEDSTLSRMVRLVAEAQSEKSGTQRFLEQAEQYYATGVIIFTVLVFLVPWLTMGQSFREAFYRAMTVMVVGSPCALVISTPATVLSAIGGAARRGILIKGGSHLERSALIDIVAIDKTGTLTVGKPSLTNIITATGTHEITANLPSDAAALLRAVASLERRSEHPLAAAIVRGASTAGLTLAEASDFQSTTGKGAEASVDGISYLVGSERLLKELSAENMQALVGPAETMQSRGRTCVWLARHSEGKVLAEAVLVMADTLRQEARKLTADLHQLGVRKVIMLTGDHRRVAAAIAEEAGVDEVRAELLPEGKVEAIRELRKQGVVMMIGDGVNDAPALAVSDIGVAMGAAGTDIAMETADIVLMGDRLENIALLVGIARRARRVLRQNLIFSGGVIVLLIAAALGFNLPLPIGVIGHEGSTVIVCLNGLRLLL